MPEKYVRRDGLPILVRHTGRTTLPQDPPALGDGPAIVCLHDAGLQSSVFNDLLGVVSDAIAFDLPGHGRSGSLDSLPRLLLVSEFSAPRFSQKIHSEVHSEIHSGSDSE